MSEHGKDTYFGVEDSAATTIRNLSGDLNDVKFGRSNDNHDDTTFGKTGHTYRNGLTDGTINISGLFSVTASTGTDTVLRSLLGLAVTVGFEYGPLGNATGKPKKTGECVLESYNCSSPVADLVTFDATFKISGAVTEGTF